ncbi:MAG: TetR/AcrR family transcriptional regulator [Clostridia bacterium]|nr:TetR/AcrR family transcriptional regulator [Clostridia bacterium]
MSRGSPARTAARREEIISACAALYETMSFKEITIKEIGAATSFTRTSIYNYFETKEEIFLALLAREYELWVGAMNAVIAQRDDMTRDELAAVLARTLTDRPRLLRLLSMNLFDMEAQSRPERLAEFKVAFGASLNAVTRMLEKFAPEMDQAARQRFLYAFFPFIYGIYPYTSVTEKQKEAMALAGIPYVFQSAYDLTYSCLKKLLDTEKEVLKP